MSLEALMKERLAAAFPGAEVALVNESSRHAGHAGDDGTGESHWALRIAAPELMALPRLARHRAVHAALGTDVMARLHALALEVTG